MRCYEQIRIVIIDFSPLSSFLTFVAGDHMKILCERDKFSKNGSVWAFEKNSLKQLLIGHFLIIWIKVVDKMVQIRGKLGGTPKIF